MIELWILHSIRSFSTQAGIEQPVRILIQIFKAVNIFFEINNQKELLSFKEGVLVNT